LFRYRLGRKRTRTGPVGSHELAPGGLSAVRAVQLTRHAIASWRLLAGLEVYGDANPALADNDLSPADVFA
jgi:hypothetical protein